MSIILKTILWVGIILPMSSSAELQCPNHQALEMQCRELYSDLDFAADGGDINRRLEIFKSICNNQCISFKSLNITETSLQEKQFAGLLMEKAMKDNEILSASRYRDVNSDIQVSDSIWKKIQALKPGIENDLPPSISKEHETVSCSSVDLRKKLGPARNQRRLGWCFAFATADFWELHSGQRISPTDIAISYYQKHEALEESNEFSNKRGGAVLPTLQASIEKGLCPEKYFPIDEMNIDLKYTLEEIEKLERNQKNVICDSPQNQSFHHLLGGIKQTTNALKQTLLEQINETKCKDKRIKQNELGNFKLSYLRGDQVDAKEKSKLIDNALDHHQPVLTLYRDPGYMHPRKSVEEFNHVVLIVGRRMNQGRCEILVRNSWGTSCDNYTSRVSCTGDGHFWVPRETLEQVVREIYY